MSVSITLGKPFCQRAEERMRSLGNHLHEQPSLPLGLGPLLLDIAAASVEALYICSQV